MDSMKSAYDRAMERVESLGAPTVEEKLQLKYVPLGERLASAYLKGQQDLKVALEECEPEGRTYLCKGITGVLIQNIRLPRVEDDQQRNKKSIQGIGLIKKDKKTVDEITSHIEYVCNTFLQYRKQRLDQTYQEFKTQFEQRVQETVKKQGGIPRNAQMNVEAMPEFQQEWNRVVSQLDTQYEDPLEEQKVLLKNAK